MHSSPWQATGYSAKSFHKKAFEQATVGGIDVRNRIFRSATYEGLAKDDGKVSPEMKEMYKTLSKGGVGLIISGYMTFSELDNYSSSTVSIASDDTIDPLSELAQSIHDLGCRIVAQKLSVSLAMAVLIQRGPVVSLSLKEKRRKRKNRF